MVSAPFLEDRPQADDMQERPLPHHPADSRPVVVIEVAMNRDAAGLSERDGFLDPTTLEVLLTHPIAHAYEISALRRGRSAGRRTACRAGRRAQVGG